MDDDQKNITQDPQITDDTSATQPEPIEDEAEGETKTAEETSQPEETQPEEQPEVEAAATPTEETGEESTEEEVEKTEEEKPEEASDDQPQAPTPVIETGPRPRWYVVHTYSGHENKVATALKQRVESEHLENKIIDVLVPTQDKIEIRSGKKETVKEKIFPGYILIKMLLDDTSWLAVRTTQGVTSFIGMSGKPTPIADSEVDSIVNFMQQGGQPTYKQVFTDGDTVKIIDGPFAEFIGKIESVDKEKGKVRILVSIFGRETPVELDFLQVAKL